MGYNNVSLLGSKEVEMFNAAGNSCYSCHNIAVKECGFKQVPKGRICLASGCLDV